MRMSRQHFEMIAEILNYERAAARLTTKDTVAGRAERDARLKALDLTAYAFAGKLAETNELFDRDRFLSAAGVKS